MPELISILGVDNDKILCNINDPPLSSISQNIEKGGYEAAALIERLYNKEETNPQDIVIEPVNIVNRLSTDYYPTLDPYILTVLNYIHRNLNNHFHVDDLVTLVPLSRRLLEIRFRQATRQSLHQYIATLRMGRFAQLLQATSEPISDVAAQVGIDNIKNLSRQFKLAKGCTPQEYRKLFERERITMRIMKTTLCWIDQTFLHTLFFFAKCGKVCAIKVLNGENIIYFCPKIQRKSK